jgi:hypothetical protein
VEKAAAGLNHDHARRSAIRMAISQPEEGHPLNLGHPAASATPKRPPRIRLKLHPTTQARSDRPCERCSNVIAGATTLGDSDQRSHARTRRTQRSEARPKRRGTSMYTRLVAYALVAVGAASAACLSPIHAENSITPVLSVPAPAPAQLTLSQRCAMASVLIKTNQCGSISCDRALGMSLRAGCRINYWGHTPKYD